MKKTESAAQTIAALNPDVSVVAARGDAHRGQRRPAHRGLRRHPRRHRHVRDALHAQRRGRARGHPGRARLGVPLRGPADGVQALRGPVLPLPLSDAAAARAGARLLGRRRARRRARRHGPAPGDRGASRSCSASATRWSAGCSSTTPSTARSPSSSCGATRTARPAATARRPLGADDGVFTLPAARSPAATTGASA